MQLIDMLLYAFAYYFSLPFEFPALEREKQVNSFYFFCFLFFWEIKALFSVNMQ